MPVPFYDRDDQRYATLPDELLEEILLSTSDVSDTISAMFEEIESRRDELRERLISANLIEHEAELPEVETPSVACVDGGSAVERSVGVDTVLAVAVGVEGLGPQQDWEDTQYLSWQAAIRHEEDVPRLARGAMAIQEITIAANAPHGLVIEDGSHLTHVISLNSLLVLDQPAVLPFTNEILERYNLGSDYQTFNSSSSIIAVPKYDSSAVLANMLGLASDDRTAMSVLLDPGEFIRPTRVAEHPWRELHIEVRGAIQGAAELKRQLDHAVKPLNERKIFYTYYRPFSWSPSYRLEIKEEAALNTHSLATIMKGLKSQVVSPEIREPYPQFLADQMAKSVGLGLQALRSAVQQDLSARANPRIMEMMSRSYRTEGA